MKILLIDDDKDLCYLTRMALTKHGYQVSAFHEATLGIKEAAREKPDLIFMDVMLPGMNGAEAVKILKKNPQLKDVPVVFLTALVDGTEKNSEDAGIVVDGLHYRTFGKPYEIEKLLGVVKKYIQ